MRVSFQVGSLRLVRVCVCGDSKIEAEARWQELSLPPSALSRVGKMRLIREASCGHVGVMWPYATLSATLFKSILASTTENIKDQRSEKQSFPRSSPMYQQSRHSCRCTSSSIWISLKCLPWNSQLIPPPSILHSLSHPEPFKQKAGKRGRPICSNLVTCPTNPEVPSRFN